MQDIMTSKCVCPQARWCFWRLPEHSKIMEMSSVSPLVRSRPWGRMALSTFLYVPAGPTTRPSSLHEFIWSDIYTRFN